MATITGAAPKTLKDLFNESTEIVRVPSDVQREYSWDEEVAVFWSDLSRFARHANDETEKYFVGSILTVWKPGMDCRLLLDGQQRLTTSTIMLAAIRDALWQIGTDDARNSALLIQRDTIAYRDDDDDEVKYFLEPTRFDLQFFRSNIQDWDPATGKSPALKLKSAPSHALILAAKKTLDSELSKSLAEIESDYEKRKWLLRIRKCLIRQITFVEITTGSEDDANEVFETINDRGQNLSPLDLLKNFLLREAKGADEKQAILDSWGTVLGLAIEYTELEQFLRHFWVSRYGDVKSRGLYKEIKIVLTKDFRDTSTGPAKQTPKAFAADLERAADVYFDFRKQDADNDDLNEALADLARLDAKPLLPVLLAAVQQNSESDAVPLARSLVSYYVRWSVIGRRESTLLEALMFGLATKLTNGYEIASAVEDLRAAGIADDDFTAAFRTANLTRPGWRRHVLERLESTLRSLSQKDELGVKAPKVVHVEHIYPQKPPAGLRLEVHDSVINRIGNLTLLHKRLNLKIRNSPYPTKKQAYLSSELLITSQVDLGILWDEAASRWSAEGIYKRQEHLSEYAVAAWPL